MITEQEYIDAITLVRNYMAQIINETENGWTANPQSLMLVEQDLSVRCFNCCKYNDLLTIGDLVKKTEKQLLRSRNFGKKSLAELKDLLSSYGLTLKK